MKYIKLFESFNQKLILEKFESEKISNTLSFVNKDSKSHFITVLKEIASTLDLPLSKYSDEYFQYLPFKKALDLNFYPNHDVKCGETSISQFGIKYGIQGEVCEDGVLKRKWGRGTRNVTCPSCSGLGTKKVKDYEIKWVKFWFDKNGQYVVTTATDGKIRTQPKSDIPDEYEVIRNLGMQDIRSSKSGTKIVFKRYYSDKFIPATIYKHNNNIYFVFNGQNPYGSEVPEEAKVYGEYAIKVNYGSDFNSAKSVRLKNKEELEDMGAPNPYTWNGILKTNYGFSIRHDDTEYILKNANFAIVLDFLELKKSSYKKQSDITLKRKEDKSGSLALMTNDEIKNINIERYLKSMSDNVEIEDDLKNMGKLFLKYMGGKYIGYYITTDTNVDNIIWIFSKIYDMLQTDNDDMKKHYYTTALSDIKDRFRSNYFINKDININLTKVKEDLISSGELDALELVKRYELFLTKVYDKFKDIKIETIADFIIAETKMKMLLNAYSNRKMGALSNINGFLYRLRRKGHVDAYEYLLKIFNYKETTESIDLLINVLEKL